MSGRRERSRSPVARRERKRQENERDERHSKHVSHPKRRQHRNDQSGRESIVNDRYYQRQDHDERISQGINRRLHEDRGSRKDDDGRLRNKHDSESRERRGREGTIDYRHEMAQNEGRGNSRSSYKRRDHRRHREEEEGETEDSSRYGQSANAEDNNTDAVRKEESNFGLSGKLTEYTNIYKGVVIKYNEPPEARKPKTRWRLYPFKGEETLPVLYIHRQSAFLLGRQRHIADIPIDHPSCSKQHAVLQYKLASYQKPDGATGRKVKPYIIDLESANGTYLNNEKIDARRYYELKERDVLKFGFSSREYVILNERSLNTEENQVDASSSNEDSPD